MTIPIRQIERALSKKNIDIIARIKELLEKNGMNQQELADKAGMRKQMVSKILSNPDNNSELETLIRLELALKGEILASRSFFEDEYISNPDLIIDLNKAVINSDLSSDLKKKFKLELFHIVNEYISIAPPKVVKTAIDPMMRALVVTGQVRHYGDNMIYSTARIPGRPQYIAINPTPQKLKAKHAKR
jgi:transcriptional regulator with XRE-family HTH domain